MKDYYFLELDKTELKVLKQICDIGYQVAKENWYFQMMIKSKRISDKLSKLEKL